RRVLPGRLREPGPGHRGGVEDPPGERGVDRGPPAPGVPGGTGVVTVATDARGVVDRLFREEQGRAVATLIRVLGDFDLAADAGRPPYHRDRPGLPGGRAGHGQADRPGQGEDPRRGDPIPRPAA